MASKVSGYIGKLNPGNGTQYSLGSTAYGYCETAASTVAKTVDMTGFTLLEGATVFIKFKEANSAANPTLNINGTGAKPIVQYGTTAVSTDVATTGWQAGAILCLTYDGTSWVRDQGYNTDTKVTSVDNHYTPSANSGSQLSASASGASAAWSIDVVKAVQLQRDAKGHVTGVTVTSGKIPANPNTDANVTQTISSAATGAYRVLLSSTADDTTRTEGARKDSDLRWTPSTNTLDIAANNANGTLKTSSGSITINSASTLYLTSGAANSIVFQHGTTESGRFSPSGNLVLGETVGATANSYAQKLYVKGQVAFNIPNGTTSSKDFIIQGRTFNNTVSELVLADAALQANNANPSGFEDGNTLFLQYNRGGVHIGSSDNTNPNSKLKVFGSIEATTTLNIGGNTGLAGNLDVTGNTNLHNQTNIDNLTAGTMIITGAAAFTQIPTAPTATDNTNDTRLATTEFVHNAFRTNDAMVFKGVVNAASDLPTTHLQGWTYKVGTAGTYAGQTCEIGDTIYCITDGTAANNNHWVVVQNNIDILPVARGGTGATTAAGARTNLLGTGTTGQFWRGDNTWSNTLTRQSANDFVDAILKIDNTRDSSWITGLTQVASNMTAGHYVGLQIGKTSGTTNNVGHLSFYYAGDQSTDNRFALGFFNNVDILVVKASKLVGIGTTSPSAKLHVSGGLLKITNNSNTVSIGSANSSWCHFENSANIPFYFNHQINAVDGFKVYNTNTSLADNQLTFAQGGGWNMTDSTWIRAYGSKQIYTANTTDSSYSTSGAALLVAGGISVTKNLSAKSIRIDNGQTSKGVSLQYDSTLEVLNFVFS